MQRKLPNANLVADRAVAVVEFAQHVTVAAINKNANGTAVHNVTGRQKPHLIVATRFNFSHPSNRINGMHRTRVCNGFVPTDFPCLLGWRTRLTPRGGPFCERCQCRQRRLNHIGQVHVQAGERGHDQYQGRRQSDGAMQVEQYPGATRLPLHRKCLARQMQSRYGEEHANQHTDDPDDRNDAGNPLAGLVKKQAHVQAIDHRHDMRPRGADLTPITLAEKLPAIRVGINLGWPWRIAVQAAFCCRFARVHDDVDRTRGIVRKKKITDDQLWVFFFNGFRNIVKRSTTRTWLCAMQPRIKQRVNFMVKRKQRAGDARNDKQRGQHDA